MARIIAVPSLILGAILSFTQIYCAEQPETAYRPHRPQRLLTTTDLIAQMKKELAHINQHLSDLQYIFKGGPFPPALGDMQALQDRKGHLEAEIASLTMLDFKERYPDAYAKLSKNLNQSDLEILLRPLPEPYNHYQASYFKILNAETLAYQDNILNATESKDLIKLYFYNAFRPLRRGHITHSLPLRFLLFSKILNINPDEQHSRIEHANFRFTAEQVFFGRPEDKEFIEKNEASPEKLREGKDLQILAGLYKIHLHPSDNFLDYVGLKMLALKTAYKQFFDEHKLVFKIIHSFCAARRGSFAPFIVIYCQSKEIAQETLDFIYKHFWNDYGIGCDWAPAYNEKVTDLIYFAQGDRGIKIVEDLQKFFEKPNLVYYRADLTGIPVDYHLKNPAKITPGK